MTSTLTVAAFAPSLFTIARFLWVPSTAQAVRLAGTPNPVHMPGPSVSASPAPLGPWNALAAALNAVTVDAADAELWTTRTAYTCTNFADPEIDSPSVFVSPVVRSSVVVAPAAT